MKEVDKDQKQQIKEASSPNKEKEAPKIEGNKDAQTQKEQADWDDFEEITKGDFKRLLGCG